MLRTLAEEIEHDNHKQSLHRLQEYYEQMAASLDDRARS
jgi:hypothetical protein